MQKIKVLLFTPICAIMGYVSACAWLWALWQMKQEPSSALGYALLLSALGIVNFLLCLCYIIEKIFFNTPFRSFPKLFLWIGLSLFVVSMGMLFSL